MFQNTLIAGEVFRSVFKCGIKFYYTIKISR